MGPAGRQARIFETPTFISSLGESAVRTTPLEHHDTHTVALVEREIANSDLRCAHGLQGSDSAGLLRRVRDDIASPH